MAVNAREILNDFVGGVGKLCEMDNDFMQKFMAVDGGAGGDVLPSKNKELIGVALGVYNPRQSRIWLHVHGAYQAGATRQEILAAAEVAIAFGGGPSVAYSASVLNAALDEFEHDFD